MNKKVKQLEEKFSNVLSFEKNKKDDSNGHLILRTKKNQISFMEAEVELNHAMPFLTDCFQQKDCPVTEVSLLDDVPLMNMDGQPQNSQGKNAFADFMSLLEDITSLTIQYSYLDLGQIKNICRLLRRSQAIRYLEITHCLLDDAKFNLIFEAVVKSSLETLSIRRNNRITSKSGNVIKKNLPKMKLKTLVLREDKLETKEFHQNLSFALRRNIFLEHLTLLDDLRSKPFMTQNQIIQKLAKIWAKNSGPRRMGLMDAQDGSIRNPKEERLPLDIRRYIHEFVPRDLNRGIGNFILWLKNLSKALKHIKGYRLEDFVFELNEQAYIRTLRHDVRPQTPVINDLIQKVNRYAIYNGLLQKTPTKDDFSRLSLFKKKKRSG